MRDEFGLVRDGWGVVRDEFGLVRDGWVSLNW